jgi:ribosomal protein S18 acetylase RimI-like enzyme
MIAINPLCRNDAKSVADLHIKNLKSNFKGLPGKKLLQYYYQCVSGNTGCVGYVARDGQNILGYVCGIWDKAKFQSKLINEFGFQLICWGLFEIFLAPKMLLNFISRLYPKKKGQKIIGYELRPIVVTEQARGTGVAGALVDQLKKDAKSRGYTKIFLVTEIENHRAQKFYEKSGFLRSGELSNSGQKYYHYELLINEVD